MNTVSRILFIVLFAVALTSCMDEDIVSVKDIDESEATISSTSSALDAKKPAKKVVDLLAGQHKKVGTVSVETKNNEKICVTYKLSPEAVDKGWSLYETHLAIEVFISRLPTNRPGNPIPGQFAYGDDKLEGVESWSYCVPVDDVRSLRCPIENDDKYDRNKVHIAAHSVVKKAGKSETAWGEGTRFVERGNWGMYFQYFPVVDCKKYKSTTE